MHVSVYAHMHVVLLYVTGSRLRCCFVPDDQLVQVNNKILISFNQPQSDWWQWQSPQQHSLWLFSHARYKYIHVRVHSLGTILGSLRHYHDSALVVVDIIRQIYRYQHMYSEDIVQGHMWTDIQNIQFVEYFIECQWKTCYYYYTHTKRYVYVHTTCL